VAELDEPPTIDPVAVDAPAGVGLAVEVALPPVVADLEEPPQAASATVVRASSATTERFSTVVAPVSGPQAAASIP
jgi:hypothetical protein